MGKVRAPNFHHNPLKDFFNKMDDAAFYTSLILNLLVMVGMILRFKLKIRKGKLTEASAKRRYTFWSVGLCVVFGFVLFPMLIHVYGWIGFQQNLGHGVVLIAGPLFHGVQCILATLVGRMLLAWKSMHW